jgi:uncharacterized protein YabE (DUF348 family)
MVYRLAEPKPVTLLVDGQASHVLTRAETVAQLLAERGYHLREQDVLQPALYERLERGLVITLRRAYPLSIHVDGQTIHVYTVGAKTADLLTKFNITLSPQDRVNPGLQYVPAPGGEVTVTRVKTAMIREEAVIPYVTESKNDPGLPRGRRLLLAQGEPGLLARSYEVTYADDKEESRRLIREETLRRPQPRKVAIGTGAAVAAASPGARGSQVVKTMQGLASWYGVPFHGRRTSSGEIFNKNALTAAHRSLPHNTRVRVTYLKTGRSVEVRINDYGPHIPGRIIDLSQAAAQAVGLKQAGIGMVKLEVLR